MKITDLDREMFIEDLGKVSGGQNELAPGMPWSRVSRLDRRRSFTVTSRPELLNL